MQQGVWTDENGKGTPVDRARNNLITFLSVFLGNGMNAKTTSDSELFSRYATGRRHQVAVKCLSKERMQNNTLEFMKEYEIMQSIEHANIVRLFGIVASETSQILLITELAPLRSLLECLKELSLRSTFNVPVLSDFAKQVCTLVCTCSSFRSCDNSNCRLVM